MAFYESVVIARPELTEAQVDKLVNDLSEIITKDKDVIVEAKIHLVLVNEKAKPIKIPEIVFENFKPYFCDSIKL